ncbi:MAG: DivIVA domain-containing protein [Erysipelotrichaceae bacterium]|nr:DivIVA domain-containing protein [Erysipelotrichaceae bacterium]
MANQPKLSAEQIFKKEFNIEFKGYSILEVDTMLDEVISDYQTFQNQLSAQMNMIDQLQRSNSNLQNKLIELQGRLEASQSETPIIQQTDLLKRLAKLEQEVYKK